MQSIHLKIRPLSADELDVVNRVVERAVMGWNLPERVKRLALSQYQYNSLDMAHMQLWVAETGSHAIIGVVAWEAAEVNETPEGQSALLLHGIYVDPDHQHRGIGSELIQAAEAAAVQAQLAGILVKAQADAVGFFHARGYRQLPPSDASRDYKNRFWKPLLATAN